MTKEVIKMAMAAPADPQASPSEVAKHLGVTTTTPYAYLNGDGTVKAPGQRLLNGAEKPQRSRSPQDKGRHDAPQGNPG
jgi:hypothetical protein